MPTLTRRVIVLGAVAAAASGLGAAPTHAATRPAAAKTCKIASLDASASKHTDTRTGRNITANDDWETVQALCNNESVTGSVRSSSTLRLTPSANKTSGKVIGKVTLDYSFGASQTGSWVIGGTSTYTCSGGTCQTRMNLTRPGQPKQIIAVLIGLFSADATALSCKVTFEDILVSSVLSPRDSQSGLPAGQQVAVSKG